MVQKKQMSSDWSNASDRMNQYVRQDNALGHRLAHLSKQESRNEKIAFKLESGRLYGLRQQYYDFILQRQLGKEMQKEHTEPHW